MEIEESESDSDIEDPGDLNEGTNVKTFSAGGYWLLNQ